MSLGFGDSRAQALIQLYSQSPSASFAVRILRFESGEGFSPIGTISIPDVRNEGIRL
jgi:hypothetical protein